MFEKMNKRNRLFALMGLAVVVIFAALSGGVGICLLGAAGMAMALPALTDEESAFLEVVKTKIAEAQEKFSKDYISATKMDEIIQGHINKALEGITTKEELDKLNKALESQGLVLKKLQSYDEPKKKTFTSTIKEAFEAEGLVEKSLRLSNGGSNVDVIKAVGTVTTGSVTTDTSGNALLDMINADELNSCAFVTSLLRTSAP